MPYVDIFDATSGDWRRCTRVIWDGKETRFEGEKFRGLEKILAPGRSGKMLTPNDGMKYLAALQYEFRGSYVRASAPKPLRGEPTTITHDVGHEHE